MSSNDGKYNEGNTSLGQFQSTNKRKLQRACDICRRKKIRCDAIQMLGTRCSNCKSHNLDCTYVEDAQKRGPPKNYVEKLEKRAEELDKLLRQLCPDETVYKELNASLDSNWIIEHPPVDPSTLVDEIALQENTNKVETGITSASLRAMKNNRDNTRTLTEFHDEDDSTSVLADLKSMAYTPNDSWFIGKSSDVMLVWTAIESKKEYTRNNGDPRDPEKPALELRRPEFWDIKEWERRSDATALPKYTFPDLDLALHCIDLYFKRDNLYTPLLHRPSFDKAVQEGRYLTDEKFGPVFLLVCAVGARYSDDPRVLLDDGNPSHSSGWQWFEQVQTMKRSLITPPTVEDLQLYCLCIQFLTGTSSPYACWTLVGVAIHLAKDAGAHRRKAHSHTITPKDELWKRAFWALVSMDRRFSPAMGRPCSIQDEDFDLDWPVDCDDEYWDNPDPEKRFKQPPNKPSLITAYILRLKLHQILAMAVRTIYSINKSKILFGLAKQEWEQDLVADLDSLLNQWVDSVPDQLRWNPKREDDKFFNQSVALYVEYYYIQILIHRPFIQSPSKPRPLTFPSLAICTNAARSSIHILHIQRIRNKDPAPHILVPTFTAGIVLLVGIWGAKRSNLSIDPNEEMAEVHRCMKILKTMEKYNWAAGRNWDMFYILTSKTSKGELPLRQPSPTPETRRAHQSDAPLITGPNESSLNPTSQNEVLGTIPGSFAKEPPFVSQMQQPPKLQQFAFTSTTSPIADHLEFALPVYSNELGSLPLYGQVSFGAQAHNSQWQTYSPHVHPQTDYWYSMPHSGSERSEPTPLAGPSSSYGLHRAGPSAPPLQQQHHLHPHHVPQSIPTDGSSSTLGMNSMAHGHDGLYGVVPPNMGASMSFESTLDHAQPHTPAYGLRPMDLLSTDMGSNSMAPPSLAWSGGSLMDNGMAKEPMSAPGHPTYHQHQGVPQQGESYYPFALETNTVAMWSNAPTGFELEKWGAYLREMMQNGHQRASA